MMAEDVQHMTNNISEICRFEKLPFVFGTANTPDNQGLPIRLPFTLGRELRTGRLVQMRDEAVITALELAYSKGSLISGFMDDNGIGRQYADDFIGFLRKTTGDAKLGSSRILEIGCGTGYLLSRLKSMGSDVLGIEPGPQGQAGKERYGIDIIQDYFPPQIALKGKFDIIIQYAVLEHLEDPLAFLDQISKYLSNDGFLVLSVPACDTYIERGDISMLLHEHFSYFTKYTLESTLNAAEYETCCIEEAGFGGAWYAVTRPASFHPRPLAPPDDQINSFAEKVAINRQLFEDFLSERTKDGMSLGIYCPGRIVNFLSTASAEQACRSMKIRFFDDNCLMHGQFYPGLPYHIESRNDLMNNPVTTLLIASWTFGAHLANDLKSLSLQSEIVTFSDLFRS